MKTKTFIPANPNKADHKKIDYWGVLFVSFIFVSSMSCFLFANNIDHPDENTLSDSSTVIDAPLFSSNQYNDEETI
ncbi:hypothetical protein J9B83_05125 [Marinomonas sp. A79]|uniref:Uncharacterized protein n=1 Tax=Marinomonas vulgaris TaxID=2823372 RepID=A0ABS5H9N0_9GAMM|nr:hypothetical protein [Marinomonas vulgaris]MBR7888320.1 hypothetical protein [Marinomonas vulgaris]